MLDTIILDLEFGALNTIIVEYNAYIGYYCMISMVISLFN